MSCREDGNAGDILSSHGFVCFVRHDARQDSRAEKPAQRPQNTTKSLRHDRHLSVLSIGQHITAIVQVCCCTWFVPAADMQQADVELDERELYREAHQETEHDSGHCHHKGPLYANYSCPKRSETP